MVRLDRPSKPVKRRPASLQQSRDWFNMHHILYRTPHRVHNSLKVASRPGLETCRISEKRCQAPEGATGTQRSQTPFSYRAVVPKNLRMREPSVLV